MTIDIKRSSQRYGLIVILILALFISAIFFYARNNSITKLSDNVAQLNKFDNDYDLIDTCVLLLYKADNNCRLFGATANNTYMKEFSKDVSRISNILDRLTANENAIPFSQNIQGLVEQKKAKMQVYLKLRRLTDRLYDLGSKIDTVKERTVFSGNEITKGRFKTMIVIDTIKPKHEVREKNLIGRLADAFTRKDKKIDTSKALVKKEIMLDTSLSSKAFNSAQIKNINAYFRNLFNHNKLLAANEIEVLRINSKIIAELIDLLNNFKKNDISLMIDVKKSINQDLDLTFKSIDNIYILILALLLVLVFVILFNLWMIYRNENRLIDYGKKASQYAQSKSRFLANMSHEIRTPLNSVIGFSEQLSQDNLSERQQEQINAIKTSSELLLDLVNDILDFSKYEDGKINFDKVSFSPADVINEVINSVGILAQRKGLTLEKQVSFKANFFLQGDSLRLKQVIMNLLSNAIKFTDYGGVILKADLISTSKKKSILKIQVIDTGIGIEEKDAALIFDEFSQVNYATTMNTQKGTGLGLAICKKIVELQGGKIGLTSEMNKGSIFTFELPYELCYDNVTKEKNLLISNVSHLAGKRILLVDDNKMNVLLAKTVVKKYEIVTDTAYDGVEAFQLFEKNEYDLVLTDIQMPLMGGVELTRLIRLLENKTKANVAVLGVTANVMEEDRNRYLAAGINDLVLKPYSEKELIEKISGYISNS